MDKISLPQKPRILIVRTDKIGDVLLTTPAAASLKEAYPDSLIAYLCRTYTAPLLKSNPAVDEVIRVDEPGESVWKLASKISALRFDLAVHFYVDFRSACATRLAKIPVRLGPRSKMASYFLSHRLIQNRSRVLKHEAEYNLDLSRICGGMKTDFSPVIVLTDLEKKKGNEILRSVHVSPQKAPIVIHPGSKGSAQTWPLAHFLELSEKLAEEFGDIVFTGGRSEENILDQAQNLSRPPHPHLHTIAAGSLTLRELAAVLSQSRLVISNSTGPLHMATALGKPTLSFYPRFPVVTSAKRWGPYGNPGRHFVLSPQDDHAPMSSITVERALNTVRQILKETS